MGTARALPGDDDMTQTFDDLVRDRFILGDPDACAAEIARCAEVTGATTFIPHPLARHAARGHHQSDAASG